MTERLTGVAGSMFSGKTAELIRLVERAEFAGKKVQIFKPDIDKRWGKTESVRSHRGHEHQAVPISGPKEILEKLTEDTRLVAIDEIQFFTDEIIPVVEELLERNIEVMFAGLPTNFRGEPFGSMPVLLSKSDNIIKLSAICTHQDDGGICGREATRTQRLVGGKPANYNDPIVLIGAEESYAPRCPDHHAVPGKPEKV